MRDDTHDIVAAFEAGADDCLVEPVAVKELSARLGAVRHRNRGGSKSSAVLVNDLSTLNNIKNTYGIDFRTTLGQMIGRNTDTTTAADIHDNVFLVAEDDLPTPTACTVNYTATPVDATHYKGTIKITNNLDTRVDNFRLTFELAQGQKIQQPVTVAGFVQRGSNNGLNLTVFPAGFGFPFSIFPHNSITPTYTASYDGNLNAIPPNFKLNGRRCDSNHH